MGQKASPNSTRPIPYLGILVPDLEGLLHRAGDVNLPYVRSTRTGGAGVMNRESCQHNDAGQKRT